MTKIKVVNIIPRSMSGESNQDSEPNIAVNALNPEEMVISAFTPDPGGGPNAPVYVSVDGGDHWALKSIVPGDGFVGTDDITLKFAQRSNKLYTGTLNGSTFDLNVLRTEYPEVGTVMDTLDDQPNFDQPFVATETVRRGADAGKDRLFVGVNDFNMGAGLTSTVEQTQFAQLPAPVFSRIPVDVRPKNPALFNPFFQNGPQVRCAVHHEGRVYATFYSWKAFNFGAVTADLVIVRDDEWGNSPVPYSNLSDNGDGLAGQRIVTGINFTFQPLVVFLAQERFGGDIAIAVDPGNKDVVYVSWTDVRGGVYTLHLKRSEDGGQTWSQQDLLTVKNGKNPGLAVNKHGIIGYLYQQVTGTGPSERWETHVRLSHDRHAQHWHDHLLCTVPSNVPAQTFLPYIGDYANIIALEEDFFGVFCANNTPDLGNFPHGVHYQRYHDFLSKTLFDVSGVTVIAASIDPFFFRIDLDEKHDDHGLRGLHHHEHGTEGKVKEILFDSFGSFEGFVLDSEGGQKRWFYSKEKEMEHLVYKAWEHRMLVRVVHEEQEEHKPLGVILIDPH
ncbi:MAG TPA: sialidase family protein [Puia sp.]|nr:sialidase family protein [Puia sp.]